MIRSLAGPSSSREDAPLNNTICKDVCNSSTEDDASDIDNVFADNETRHEETSGKKRIILNEQAKQICLNVYNNLKNDPQNKTKESVIKKAASLTGIPYSTMCDLVRQGIRKRKRRSDAGKQRKLDSSTTKLLRNVVYDKCKKNEIPTVDIIQNELLTMDRTYPKTTLQRWLKKIGFRFKIVDKRAAIMESRRIVEWRFEYLNKIKEFRNENRAIYYLDETWYDTHDTAKKGWTDNSDKCQLKGVPPNRGSRLIIIHCGSTDGWVPNGLKLCGKKMEDCNVDYHKNMQSEIFEEWFEHTLIPNLKPNSVIVMDNASYHSRQSLKIPSTSSSKSEIQNFLISHDLYFEEWYTNKQLLEVLCTKKFEKQYVTDNIARNHGHTVLRLPPYYCIFNPIEMIWGQLKRRIRRRNTFPKFDRKVIDLIKSEMSLIGEEDWKKSIGKAIKCEDEYRTMGQILMNGGDKFIINLEDTDEEEEEWDEEM